MGITNTELTQQAVLEKYLCKLLNICELKKTQYVKAVYIYEQCTLQEKEQLLDGFFLQGILYHHNKEYIKNMLKQIPLITEKMLEEGSVFNRRQVQYMQEWENFLLFIIEWNNRRIQAGLSPAPDSQIVCPVNGDTQKKLVEYQQKIHALEQQRRQEKKLEADKSALLDSLSAKEKEIQRLKKELEENSKDKKELIGLRNFLYQAAEAPENDTHDGYIQMDLTNVYDGTEESGTDGLHIQMELADAVNNYFSILENLPEANSLQNVLTRYSKIILDNIEDQGSTSETVSAGAVQQDLTVSEGHITQKSAKSLLQAVLSTAKTDSELESIVENWTAIMNNPDYTYDAFVDSIAELEGALVDDDTDAAGLTLRAWTDDAGNVVGQQLLWKDGNIEQNFITYLKTSAGTESGYLLKLAGDEDGILLEGSGKIADDLLNGTYTLTMDGSEIAIIDVADYDTAAIKDGVWNGTYIISGSAYETEDGEETDTLNKMQLIFGSDGMDNKNLSVRCSLVNNGAYLGTLFFTSDMENGIESVDPASLNDVYDFNDPDQAAAYTESINLDAIEAGLTDAGMPEGWLDSIISSFSSLEEDISSEAPEDELIKLEPAA